MNVVQCGRRSYRACEQLGVDTNAWNQPGDAYGHLDKGTD